MRKSWPGYVLGQHILQMFHKKFVVVSLTWQNINSTCKLLWFMKLKYCVVASQNVCTVSWNQLVCVIDESRYRQAGMYFINTFSKKYRTLKIKEALHWMRGGVTTLTDTC